ncbi:MAG: undecaprenyl-phosphate glucose phosphotransferase [Hoeflea sp.]|uniref:undecaprenyl-phosphate glucose phosphotransferase n=1 Tax=Hoeflea sp. TaxID=1940281 RepID=UPI002730087D|nr:undecaprenyl-phosphate glucose phosphotransferase [Hoeflea sp.]MDP2118956.1 undecaprenyl-phosphate glucose phosphotransferase [Hoeflea sp.]MDP3527127.1 undecaprenyl-phosphate glucose phosphotransferase [Hoeflea sp.]
MNKMDRDSAFNPKAIRKAMAEIDVKPSLKGKDGETAVELSRLAHQTANRLSEENLSPTMIVGTLRLAEFALLALTGFLVYALYVGMTWEVTLLYYAPAILSGSALAVLLIQIADGYQVPALRSVLRTLPKVLTAWAAAFAMIALAAFFLQYGLAFSRFWFATWFIAGAISLAVGRNIVAYGIRRWARNGVMERRAVIVGGGEIAKALIRSIEQDPNNDIRICGIFDDRDERRSPAMVAGYPKLGNVDALVKFARMARIDMLIIAMPLNAESRVLQLLKKLWILPLDIRLAAHANKLRFRPRAYSYVGAVPMLDIFDRPITDWDSVAKRIFDVFFSVLAIALLWPVMVATAIAIKLDSKGPVLFMQKRHGFNNEVIEVFKFRSMYTDQCDPAARVVVTKGDPRVTKVGRFIRKTSIDELPQFFNVLRGDLSLVGPRPHAVVAVAQDRLFAEVVDGYFARHRVKPGVTGWAQINGWRGEIDNDEKIKQRTACDLYYIENWSLLFDLKILFLTPIRLFNTEHAY